MKRLSAALATLLLLGTSALAAPPASPPGPDAGAMAAPAPTMGKDGPAPRPGEGPMRPGGPMRPPRAELAMHLAMHLAAAETLIGIRSDQLDAWRDYTGALIDFLTPPPRPMGAGPMGSNFLDRQEEMATRLKDRAAKADALLAAITALKAKLTPEQVDRLGKVDLMMHPPMRPGWSGRPGDGPMNGGWAPGGWAPGPMDHPDGGPAGMMGPADGPDMPGPQDQPLPTDEATPPAPPAPAIPDQTNQSG